MPAAVLPAVLLAVLLAALPAGPAHAHPLGPPPTALLSAAGATVTITWAGAVDDHLALGEHLGLLPAGTAAAYLDNTAQVAPSRADVAALSTSPTLVDYLLDHVVVRQAGSACDGSAPPPADFTTQGATVVYRCPQPVTAVELEITMLTDVHEAYRTFGIAQDEAADPQQAVFTATDPVVTWRFGGAPATAGRTPALPIGLGVGAVALAGAVLAVRRR